MSDPLIICTIWMKLDRVCARRMRAAIGAIGGEALSRYASGPDAAQARPRSIAAGSDAALGELEMAGVAERPRTVLADAGYWHTNQMEHLLADGFQVLVPPDSMVRQGTRPGWEGGMYSFMRRVLSTNLAVSRTSNADTASNRSSGRSNTTAESGGSDDEAGLPCDPNGA